MKIYIVGTNESAIDDIEFAAKVLGISVSCSIEDADIVFYFSARDMRYFPKTKNNKRIFVLIIRKSCFCRNGKSRIISYSVGRKVKISCVRKIINIYDTHSAAT